MVDSPGIMVPNFADDPELGFKLALLGAGAAAAAARAAADRPRFFVPRHARRRPSRAAAAPGGSLRVHALQNGGARVHGVPQGRSPAAATALTRARFAVTRLAPLQHLGLREADKFDSVQSFLNAVAMRKGKGSAWTETNTAGHILSQFRKGNLGRVFLDDFPDAV